MRIVSLEPFLTEIVNWFGLRESLVGVSHQCRAAEHAPPLTREVRQGTARSSLLSAPLSSRPVDFAMLRSANPDIVLTSLPDLDLPDAPQGIESTVERELGDAIGHPVRLRTYNPRRLEEVFLTFAALGVELGVPAKGRDLESRSRAQMMDWADNFYDRTKNKRVTILSSFEPMTVAGVWVPDMILMGSGMSQAPAGKPDKSVSWDEIVAFRPDVLLVAPRGYSLEESRKLFTKFEALPGWDTVNAVKRGECFFADGLEHFYIPGPSLINSMGILISAMAGIDSGYITKRDSFFRLRYLELHRHRL